MSPTETSLDETSLTSPGNSTSKGDHQVEQGLILKYFLPYNYNGFKVTDNFVKLSQDKIWVIFEQMPHHNFAVTFIRISYGENGLKYWSQEDVGDSMAMDEDYMFNTVNVDDVHSIDRGIKSVDVDKLKQTLATIKTKRERQQVVI